jgi:hypothetical protein
VLTVGDDVWGRCLQGLVHTGSSAYFQIWKVRLCPMKNDNKMGKKSGKKGGMVLIVGDDVWGCYLQGLVHISKYRK